MRTDDAVAAVFHDHAAADAAVRRLAAALALGAVG